MADVSVEQILTEINELQEFHRSARAFFPRLTDEHLGVRRLPPVPYYALHGMEVSFNLSRGLTKEDVVKNNAVADLMNQNVIVRLCSLLEHQKISADISKIDKKLLGRKEVHFVWKLRNIFAHKSGSYKPTEKHEKRVVRQLNTFLILVLMLMILLAFHLIYKRSLITFLRDVRTMYEAS